MCADRRGGASSLAMDGEGGRSAHVGAVELDVLGWVGADKGVRPAHQDIGVNELPLGQILGRLDVHRQVGKTGDAKTELAGGQARLP